MTVPLTVATMRTPRKEIRRRIRRQVMLRRLTRELAQGDDVNVVLRKPFSA